MEPDPTILARQATATATALVWPEPTLIAQPAGAGAAAQAAHPAAAALGEVTEPPDLDHLGDRIAELSSRIDAATYELLCYLREFDRQHGWEGFRSCAHWLNWRTGLDHGAAREKLRVAAALAELPHIAAAMACGRLSYSKVRALSRVAAPATEARLLAVACGATAAQVERLVRGWRQADQAAQADGEQVRLASRMLSTQVDDNGMLLLRARLTPEVGAVLLRAVEAALEQVPAPAAGADGDEPTIAQRRADALGLVAESALAGGLDPGNPGDRFQVTVHVPADTLASREPASTTPRVSAEPRAASAAASQPVAAAAHAGRETAAGRASEAATAAPHVSAEPSEASDCAYEPETPAAGLDAGQAVIEQAGGLHRGARCRSQDARGPDRPAPRSAGPRSQPVPVPRLHLPPLRRPPRRALGRRRGDQARQPGFAAGSTTARCTKRAFRWWLTPPGSSSSWARTAWRCRRSRRRRVGRGRRWRRPTRGWRQPASASVPIPPPPTGTENHWT